MEESLHIIKVTDLTCVVYEFDICVTTCLTIIPSKIENIFITLFYSYFPLFSKSTLLKRSCCSVFCHCRLVCIFQNFTEMTSERLYYFVFGFFNAVVFWGFIYVVCVCVLLVHFFFIAECFLKKIYVINIQFMYPFTLLLISAVTNYASVNISCTSPCVRTCVFIFSWLNTQNWYCWIVEQVYI